MRIAFYYVDEEYIQYLKRIEMNERGFTTVPNMSYHRNNKFVYGVVLSINDIDYYVPFSHYDKKQKDNLQARIQKTAKKTYNRVIAGEDQLLVNNSCLFLKLEEACKKYKGND